MFAHGETVTRLRGVPIADPYSGEATDTDWSDPDSLTIPGCGFSPGTSLGSSSEPVQNARNSVTTKPEVYAPTGADILAADRVVVRGKTYDVDGEPADWRSPFTGWAPGLVVALTRTEG